MTEVTFSNRIKDYVIGDKFFYRKVFRITLPIIVQTTITNVVSLIDNIMVGQVGTLEMSAVAIINQLLFVFNLCIFGGLSGAGIFAIQYAGAKNDDGIRQCFRVKLVISAAVMLLAIIIFGIFPRQLISAYLAEGTSPADAQLTMKLALEYLQIMMIGNAFFAFSQVYSSSLRELGETRVPMYASMIAIVVNVGLNYVLIFGHFGFPAMGVLGAAVATTVSRCAEMIFVVTLTHVKRHKYTFIKGVYRSVYVSSKLWQDVCKRGLPILFNEFLWSLGMAMYLQCYSVRGLNVVAAANIASTVNNLFSVIMLSIGTAVSIMVGQHLGANEPDEAQKTAWKLIWLSVLSCTVLGAILAIVAPYIPQIYNTEQEVKMLATNFLYVIAITLPIHSFTHDSYFIIRSGGKTLITFLFDSCFMWFVAVPTAYILANHTSIAILPMYAIVTGMEVVKSFIAFPLVKKGIWISNIVADK